MESFRKWKLHGPERTTSPAEGRSLGEAVFSLVAEERIRQLFTTSGHSEHVDGIHSMSSGSMSPDLGEMRHQGYPDSPQWDGGLELGIETMRATVMVTMV